MSRPNTHLDRTLDDLEGDYWPAPNYPISHLVAECHRLRAVPLKELTPENLRIMIGQNIGLDYLMPLAVGVLEQDPQAAGDLYAGALMEYVRARHAFLSDHPDLKLRLDNVAARQRGATAPP